MNSPIMFGEWLRQRRDALGLTRKEFARRVGCSVSTLRKIEDGERRPSGQIAELMANCLNIPPAERATFVRVARGELNVERLFPVSKLVGDPNVSPVSTASAPRVNLPRLPTPLIGRKREVDELIRLLHDPQCRLLTLVGPGGIGKTRLAIDAASHMQEVFADGVYFIPLAPVNSTRFIAPVIADAIGFAFQGANSADPKTQLFNYLKQRQILLLTDNLEHLLTEPGIELLAELLANAPQVKLLVTSRESLRLQGEWIFEVHGLRVPADLQTEGFALDTSIELFIQRARRAHVEFNAAPQDLPAILRICQLVDGMPLAIELAAAWVRALTCDEIAKEIERGLDFLSVSTRDLPARHRSLRAVFNHSWQLLTEEEQQALARLSVFRGGFQRDAAEQVVGASLSMLSALMTKSLIRRSGDQRFDLHELIRQYALERLADQPKAQNEAQERHALYYLEYFDSRANPLRSSAQHETVTELSVEMDNFRVAWDWALTHREFDRARQVAKTLWYLLELRTWFEEGTLVFSKAAETIQSYTAKIGNGTETLEIANELEGHAAFFMFRRGNTVAAYEALTLVKAQLSANASRYVQLYLGIVCRDLGKFTEANEVLQDSLETAEEFGDPWCQSMAGQFLGIIALEIGDYDLAQRYLMEALTLGREMGDPMLIAHALGFVSLTIQNVGETAKAEKFLQESLALTQKIGYRWGVGNALDGLGILAQEANPHEARKLFAAGSDIYREIGDLRSLARARCHQGFASLTLDDISDAQKSFTEALILARTCNYTPYALDALTGIATLQAKRGEIEQALELLLIVLAHSASVRDTRNRAEQLRNELEAQLTKQQVEAAEARAQAKTFEDAVDEVLKLTELT